MDAAKLDAAAVRAVVVAETESGLTSAIGDLPGSLSGAPTSMTAGPPTRPDHQQEGVKIHNIAPAGELSDLGMIKAYRKGKSAR